jgi:outer membrane protein insertion porin family
MKAASRLMSAVSAVAITTSYVIAGATTVQMTMIETAEAASVSRIEVRGNRRIDADSVRGQLGIRPGQNFNRADLDEAVKRLFATGLFSDVSVNQSGNTLVVTVTEYAIVNQVLFQGNKKIKDANLSQAVQLQPRRAFSREAMEADAEAIREAYRRIGRDDATVSAQVQELDGGRVNVVFNVQEGDRTKIADIAFEGNQAFGDRRLREVINTKETNFLSFLSRNDVYDENRIRADEEALRRFYFNQGYADFRVLDSNVTLVDNKYNIVFTIDEGQRYTFSNVSIESTVPGVDVASLQSELQTRSGNVYRAKDVEASIISLTERLAGSGYAFAEVTPRGNRDFANRTISVVYSVDEGVRAYIERIEIRGNNRTRDYVIRREFDVSEGDAFNQVMISRAKRRLDNLGFFQTVNISTVPGSQPDQVVLVVDVVETATGEFSIGAGYTTGQTSSSSGGFSLEGSITERNFLGRGQFIRFSAAGGEDSRDFTLSFTEPYFLGRRISAGFDIYRNTRKVNNSNNDHVYDRETTGGTIRFGLPITEALTAQVAYNYSQDDYERYGDVAVSSAIQQALDQGTWRRSSISTGLVYNTIDDQRNPRDGIYATAAVEFAGLGGDAKYVKVTGRGNYYQTLSEDLDLVGLVTVGAGHVSAWGDEPLRIFDHFNSNDRIIRGFKYNGIGPYESVRNNADQIIGRDFLGGTTYFHGTVEAQFPIPVLPESIGLRGAVFADAATLYGNDFSAAEGTDLAWRASVGASLIWASPFGPLRVDYAEPVVKEDTDRIQHWNFGISTRF